MPRAGDCRVCARADVDAIDARLKDGEPAGTIARDTGIPRSTIRVHWSRCRKGGKETARVEASPAPDALALPPADIPVGHPVAPLLEQLAEIHGHALEAYRAAVASDNVNRQILLLPQLRGNLKQQEAMLAKVEQPKDETERLMSHPDFAETALEVAAALDVPASGTDEWRAGWAACRASVLVALERMVGE